MNPPPAVAISNVLPPEIDPSLFAILLALDEANPFGKSSISIPSQVPRDPR